MNRIAISAVALAAVFAAWLVCLPPILGRLVESSAGINDVLADE